MKRLKKAIVFVGIVACSIGSFSTSAHASQVRTYNGYPVSDTKFIGVEINDGGVDTTVDRVGNAFAPVYDPRTTGAVGAIENQGYTDTCWAFASIAAIESNLIKKGYENSSVNLSENHLAYFFYNRQNDPLGYTDGDKNFNRKSTWARNGGTLQGTALHLMTWSGVVRQTYSEDYAPGEAIYPNEPGGYKPLDIDASAGYNRDYVVKNTYFYNYDVNTLKQAIMNYGAVAIGFSMDFDCYLSNDEKSYYSPIPINIQHEHAGGHAVAIIGWDDTYSRTNFKTMPSRNGAWIVKNSYGAGFGDNGYMYISYDDASISDIVSYDAVSAADISANNYQHDGTANPSYVLNLKSGTSCANVFQAKASSAGYNEILDAVGVYVATSNVNYSVQIYTGLTSNSNPTKGKKMFSSPQRGTLSNAGYNRIELTQPVTLAAGEKYSVVITLSTANGSKVQMGVEADYYNNWIGFDAGVKKSAGFIKEKGKWIDYGNSSVVGYKNICNLRIKAYTRNTVEKTTYKLSKSEGISKGSSKQLSLKITPASVKRKVTWTSSNKNVATISSSGKIKAKAYGTTTIKAKFVAGKKTKTLTCKVTVGPSKIKSFKVKGSKGKITATWKKSSGASGYAVYYSTSKDGSYKSLGTVKSGSKTKYTKKMKPGTYYVKVKPYMVQNGKKLYGSFTSVKQVDVK